MGRHLLALVAEGQGGRMYLPADSEQIIIAGVERPEAYPDADLPNNPRDFKTPNYGMTTFADLFTNRQLVALTTFSELIGGVRTQIEADGGSAEYAQSVSVYLAFVVDKMTDYHSSACSWHTSGEKIRNTFGRQAIPMVWDYAEANPFCASSESYDNMLGWVVKSIGILPATSCGVVTQFDAQSDYGLENIMISTDPPYYDNIAYADLSDFFYVWMRQSLKDIYPALFRTMLVPKAEELVATPYRFGGSTEKAKMFFEDGMVNACKRMYAAAVDDIPVTIYYAFKQRNTDTQDATASMGWETMLSAIIRAGFCITGT